MSYYVTWHYNDLATKYTPDQMKKFEEIFAEEHPEYDSDYIAYYEKDGTFIMDDNQLNWDEENDVLFLEFLSKYYSGELFLFGEDNEDRQRITMQANGEYTCNTGEIIYGDLVDEIIKRDDLPENLKKQLLDYKTAREI